MCIEHNWSFQNPPDVFAAAPLGFAFENFSESLKDTLSPGFKAAGDSVWSGLGLLSLAHTNQAFLLLMQAAEVSLRSIIDDLHRSLGAPANSHDSKLDSLELKSVTKSELRELLCSRTSFVRFYEFVQDRTGIGHGLFSEYRRLYNTRNKIAHEGEVVDDAEILVDIVDFVLPLIEDVFTRYVRADFTDRISCSVVRELLVARRFIEAAGKTDAACRNALRTFRCAYGLHSQPNHVAHATNCDPFGNVLDEVLDEQFRQAVGRCGDFLANDISDLYLRCRLCAAPVYVAIFDDYEPEDAPLSVGVAAVGCPRCRFFSQDSDFVDCHFGRLQKETVGKEEWNLILKNIGAYNG